MVGSEGIKINRSGYDGSDDVERDLLKFYLTVSLQELTPSRMEFWRIVVVCCRNMLDTRVPLVILSDGAIEQAEELVARMLLISSSRASGHGDMAV